MPRSAALTKPDLEPQAPAAEFCTPEALIATTHADPAFSQAQQLLAMSAQTGRKPTDLAMEFARLSAGPGKLGFQDYVQLRLFDDAFVGGADKRAFSGRYNNSKLVNEINYDRDWHILSTNKVAMSRYLSAHGFPTIGFQALYVEDVSWPSAAMLTNPAALCDFMANRAEYPVFCKPTDGDQSLGSIVVRGLSDDKRAMEVNDGRWMRLEDFAQFVGRTYPRGYLIQSCVRPAAALAPITGGALATCRVLTIFDDGKATVLRACLKLPTNGNVADNYWRPGNMLAGLDLETGAVRSASQGVGLDLVDVDLGSAHGGLLSPLSVPDWSQLLDLAKAGQSLMRAMPLLGWDIAPTESGPVIVEMNVAPDTLLNQLADRQGWLDPRVLDLAARARAACKIDLAKNKAKMKRFSEYRV